jgi:hypothetical protein
VPVSHIAVVHKRLAAHVFDFVSNRPRTLGIHIPKNNDRSTLSKPQRDEAAKQHPK